MRIFVKCACPPLRCVWARSGVVRQVHSASVGDRGSGNIEARPISTAEMDAQRRLNSLPHGGPQTRQASVGQALAGHPSDITQYCTNHGIIEVRGLPCGARPRDLRDGEFLCPPNFVIAAYW